MGGAAWLVRSLRSLGVELKDRVAVTGEVDLRGRLLPVAVIASKLQAAFTAGCCVVAVPAGKRAEVAGVGQQQRGAGRQHGRGAAGHRARYVVSDWAVPLPPPDCWEGCELNGPAD